MKRFLYAVMVVSLGITALSMTGCGKKKDVVKEQRMLLNDEDTMTDEELLNALNELDEEELEEELESEEAAELEEEIVEAELEEELDDIYQGMTPEEIEEAERLAMEELAALIAQEQGERTLAMGPDAFDIENMTPEQAAEFAEYQKTAEEWARQELALAAQESEAFGFQRIEFAPNSSTILPGQEEALANNVKFARLALEQGHDLVIGAHAEPTASSPVELSNARAEELRKALAAAGVDANHLHAAGYGNYLIDATSHTAANIILC